MAQDFEDFSAPPVGTTVLGRRLHCESPVKGAVAFVADLGRNPGSTRRLKAHTHAAPEPLSGGEGAGGPADFLFVEDQNLPIFTGLVSFLAGFIMACMNPLALPLHAGAQPHRLLFGE